MTHSDAARVVADRATLATVLLEVLRTRPDLAVEIATHPNVDDELLHALAALNDTAVDSVLMWRQPPADGWGRELSGKPDSTAPDAVVVSPAAPDRAATTGQARDFPPPSALDELHQPDRSGRGHLADDRTIDGSGRGPWGGAADSGASHSWGDRWRRHRGFVAAMACACLVVLGAGVAISQLLPNPVGSDAPTTSPQDGPPTNGGASPDPTVADPIVDELPVLLGDDEKPLGRWLLQRYSSLPYEEWTLAKSDLVAAAQTVDPELDPDEASVWLRSRDFAALASVSSAQKSDPEEWTTVLIGVDLTTGDFGVPFNPPDVIPGATFLSCDWEGDGMLACMDESRSSTALVDYLTGESTVLTGDWPRVAAGRVLRFVPDASSNTDGVGPAVDGDDSEDATRGVTITAQDNLETTQWETRVTLADEFATQLQRRDFGPDAFFSPIVVEEPYEDSGLITVSFRAPGSCMGDGKIRKNDVSPIDSDEQSCFEYGEAYHVGIDAETGEVRYSGPLKPVALVGGDLIAQDPALTVRRDASDSGETPFDIGGSVIATDGTVRGSISLPGVGSPSLAQFLIIDGDRALVLKNDRIEAYGDGQWDDPQWSVAEPLGLGGSREGFILGDAAYVSTFTGSAEGGGGGESLVTAYDLSNGARLWSRDANLLGTDGSVVVISTNLSPTMMGVVPTTGVQVWELNLPGTAQREGEHLVFDDNGVTYRGLGWLDPDD